MAISGTKPRGSRPLPRFTAIKAARRATVHAIRLTDFADDFSGMSGYASLQRTCWGGSTEDDPRRLLHRREDCRWRQRVEFTTTSGGDTIWTIEDLVTDVDMGDFADLLTSPQDYRPFLWLREALDRVDYVRKMRGRCVWNLDDETFCIHLEPQGSGH